MTPSDYYLGRIKALKEKESDCQKKADRFPYYRLLMFFTGAVGFYFLFGLFAPSAFIFLFLFLIAFVFIAKADQRNHREKEYLGSLIKISQQEISCINHEYNMFPDGETYLKKDHYYAYDLDIFGKHSLFQYLNRTTSQPGSDKLARLIGESELSKEKILERQGAVMELKDMPEWRQDLIAAGMEFKNTGATSGPVIEWLKQPTVFLQRKALKIATIALPLLTVALGLGWMFNAIPPGYPLLVIFVNSIIIYFNNDKVVQSHYHVSQKVELLQAYSSIIKNIEKVDFKSAKLTALKKQFAGTGAMASSELEKLSVIVNYLDFRYNIYFWIPLNTLFFWDFHWIRALEKWQQKNKSQMQNWFGSMAEFEAFSCLANASFNNFEWRLPVINTGEVEVTAQNAGHPLIPYRTRIVNDIHIQGSGKIMLITGSNMAGKSTYLRTIGINSILAMAGCSVCASSFSFSPFITYTSMRISDSLEDNTSSFYAELKRLKKLIEMVESKERVLFLLDEILRGTNSNDRHIGSKALIKQMIKNKGTGVIATHDLELGHMADIYPDNIQNYSFDVQIEDESLFFDYKLHPGICKSLNASILMKKMGFEMEG
jgi:hypothetical protein